MIKRLRCHSDSRFRIAFGQLSGLCWPCLHTLIAGQWRGRAATRQEILGRFQIGYFSLAKTRPQAPSHHNQGNLIICYAAHNFTCKRNNQPTNQSTSRSEKVGELPRRSSSGSHENCNLIQKLCLVRTEIKKRYTMGVAAENETL